MYPTIFDKRTRRLIRVSSKDLKTYQASVQEWAFIRRTELNAVRAFLKSEIKATSLLRIDCAIHLNHTRMITKDGRRKAFDAHNRLKALFDGIAAVLQLDDRYFYCGEAKPKLSEKEQIDFTLSVESL